jgi:hypothetical protein
MALCSKPYITPRQQPVPCGQCKGCLTNRKQLWTHRILLESRAHEKNCFVTLTYSDENIPVNEKGIPTLRKEDLQLFIKRLRRQLPDKCRYYAVGEYGTSGSRGINPHFHLCLFNVGEEQAHYIERSWVSADGTGKQGSPLGFTYTGSLTPQSAAYVAQYFQKKNKYNKDMYDEFEIVPEYSTMSLKPAIGYSVIDYLVKTIEKYPETLTPAGDVPYSLKHGDRSLPLGNYLRQKLREKLNMDHSVETLYDETTGEIIREKIIWHAKERQKEVLKAEMQDLQQNKENDPKLPKDAKVSITQAIAYRDGQQVKNFEKRQQIYSKKGIL